MRWLSGGCPKVCTVTIDGKNVTTLPMYRRHAGYGYLPQEMSIFRGLRRAGQYLGHSGHLDLCIARGRRERLRHCCRNFPSNTCAAPPALAAVGGERRRVVEIARCLASDPKLPTAG